MKKNFLPILLIPLLCLIFSPVHTQTMVEDTGPTVTVGNYGNHSQGPVDVTCAPDTVAYPNGKATGLRLLSVNTASSGQSLYQFYEAPQAITVSGFDFFAYAPNSGDTVWVACEIYKASPDSLPIGPPLASDTVIVDSSAGGFTLNELRRSANFATPVTVTEPYILVFTNPNAANVSIVCNDWDLLNGGFEWLSGADFRNLGGVWTRGYDVNVGLAPFNADIYLFPYAEYDLDPLFSADQTCFSPTTAVQFINYSSPIVDSRMYNTLVFNFTGTEYTWNFGDGSPASNQRNPSHSYTIPGPFTAVLSASIFGWTNVCVANYGIPLGPSAPPTAEFITLQNDAYVDLTNITSGGVSYVWDFGDGTSTSILNSPTHFYNGNGTYIITLTATGACGTDVKTDTVIVNCDQPVAGFSSANSGFLVNFTDASQFATDYIWDFGDGMGTSVATSPNYIYANFGAYEVILIVSSSCGTDTLRDSVFVLNPNNLDPVYGTEVISLFPNPGSSIFHLDGALAQRESLDISLLGPTGQVLASWKTSSRLRVDFSMDLSSFPVGYYLLEIRGQAGRSIRKLAIMR